MSTNNVGRLAFKQVNGSKKMDELWFNTGSRCNLTCIHCYIDSNPKNDSLNQLSLDDIQDELQTAKIFGVAHIYFTGGEPFINRDIIAMIEAAVAVADTTILTNGTKPVRKHIESLFNMNKNSSSELYLRVSLDHYQAARHDLLRGRGKFNETIETVKQLYTAGFENIIITPTAEVFRGNSMTEDQVKRVYRNLFLKYDISVAVKVIPSILEMGAQIRRVQERHEFVRITQNELNNTPEEQLPQCYNGRSVQKIGGEKMVLPCPILYQPEFNMGSSLKKAIQSPVPLLHKECYHYCMKSNGRCGN